ncbi:hypothetical protein DFH09DRAFT_1093409 [Mycena vulgaris]|nr:hypothetical protein DFH09DRAFT_1093409 [Mycena vulgaris]
MYGDARAELDWRAWRWGAEARRELEAWCLSASLIAIYLSTASHGLSLSHRLSLSSHRLDTTTTLTLTRPCPDLHPRPPPRAPSPYLRKNRRGSVACDSIPTLAPAPTASSELRRFASPPKRTSDAHAASKESAQCVRDFEDACATRREREPCVAPSMESRSTECARRTQGSTSARCARGSCESEAKVTRARLRARCRWSCAAPAACARGHRGVRGSARDVPDSRARPRLRSCVESRARADAPAAISVVKYCL